MSETITIIDVDTVRLIIEFVLAITSIIFVKKYKIFKGKSTKFVKFITTLNEAVKDKRITKAEMNRLITEGNDLLIQEGDATEAGEGN